MQFPLENEVSEKKEYYLEERGREKSKANKDLIGEYFFAKRYIKRVGYMF